MRTRLSALALASLLLAGVPASALAAKPIGGGGNLTGSLTLVMIADANGNGQPNWNDTISWIPVSTKTSYPYVEVLCYQAGTLIYSASAGFFAGYPWPWAVNMRLDSQAWPDGTGADCTAQLYYPDGRRTRVDARYAFTVAP